MKTLREVKEDIIRQIVIELIKNIHISACEIYKLKNKEEMYYFHIIPNNMKPIYFIVYNDKIEVYGNNIFHPIYTYKDDKRPYLHFKIPFTNKSIYDDCERVYQFREIAGEDIALLARTIDAIPEKGITWELEHIFDRYKENK